MISDKHLEYDTWYWITHSQEGGIWYPVYINSNFEYVLDGKHHSVLELKHMIVKKAVMPCDEIGND